MHELILTKKLRELSKQYKFYADGEKTLVGFSGGADSTALLHALSTYLGKNRIVAFHLNHMLRGAESLRDEAFCRAFCAEHEIVFACKRVDIRALSGGTALEETARKARYEALNEAAVSYGCTTVSLAHHAADNLETMLFHLCRGAGLHGIAGIPPKRPLENLHVVRPLLDCTREDILSYLEANSLSFVVDSTNTDTEYTRNFIRERILPPLKKINPQAEENARKTADIARNAASHLEAEATLFLNDHPSAEAPAEKLRALSPALLYAVLAALYKEAGGETLSAVQSAAIIELLFEQKRGHKVSLSGKITAKFDGEMLRFLNENDRETPVFCEKIPLHMGENRLENGIFVFIDMQKADFSSMKKEEIRFCATARLPKASLETLCLRPRENGEGYRFGGMTRRFKKLLSGTDSRTKNRPIFCDKAGILWHPNFPPADRAKAAETIEVVYIEIKGE